MGVLELLTDRVNADGWLSVSSLFFDNALTVHIPTAKGYIAYSPSAKAFFILRPSDSTDSGFTEANYIFVNKPNVIEMQKGITVVDANTLFHWDAALYSRASYYNIVKDEFPLPTFPSKEDIADFDSISNIENLGHLTYPNAIDSNGQPIPNEPTIGLYNDYPNIPLTAVRVNAWKTFNENQEMFKTAMETLFNLSDCI